VVCEGLKNHEIARRLQISETTVRHHLSSIFTKLNVGSRFELVVFLIRNRLFEPAADPGAPGHNF
jgi:DNA-binding NarL/FixJ family response regulator